MNIGEPFWLTAEKREISATMVTPTELRILGDNKHIALSNPLKMTISLYLARPDCLTVNETGPLSGYLRR